MSWTAGEIPGGFKWTEPDGAEIWIEFIHPTARGLDAWVELRLPGQVIPVAEGTRNLMTPDAIEPFLRRAKAYNGDTNRDLGLWELGLRIAFHETIEKHRDGSRTVDLSLVEPEDLDWLINPLIEAGGATRLIAAGGSGKSLFAMAACLTVATGRQFLPLEPGKTTGPTLYLDWETNAATHARRIAALCAPLQADLPAKNLLLYRSESVPLFRSAQAIRRVCDRQGVRMIVVDSAKMAAGPSGGSGSSAEDSTLNLYLALREIGRPALIIDHKTKADIAKGKTGGYGSVFYENLARLQWEMTQLVELSVTERTFVLKLMKQNNVGRISPLGFRMETTGGDTGLESAQFRRADPYELPNLEADDQPERVASVLGGSDDPLTIQRIAELIYGDDSKSYHASIRTRLNGDRRFVNVSHGHTGQWTLKTKGKAPSRLEAVPDPDPPLRGDDYEGTTY